MDVCINSLGDASVYSALDANSVYWQMPIAKEDRKKTNLPAHRGALGWLRMSFGLRNAPATFHRSLGLPRVRVKTFLVYLDDFLMFSRKLEDHLKHIDEVLTLLENDSVSLKILKCQLFPRRLE